MNFLYSELYSDITLRKPRLNTRIACFLILLPCLFLSSCYYLTSINDEPDPTFTEVKDIRYTEVHRRFGNGLSFNKYGFQLEPEWKIYFNADDSVRIFSPEKNQYMTYRIFHSHKDLFNFARDWFRVKHVSKDSLILQVMRLEARVVNEELSDVYMTLYADDYIRDSLNTTAEILKRPSAADTLYMNYRAIEANSTIDSAFAARNPVVFKSKSPIISAEKLKPVADPYLGQISRSDAYLYPEYRIRIDKAYNDFNYSFSAVVDHNGKIHFKRFLVAVEPEFKVNKEKVARGIIDVYLKNLLDVTPGNTLGFPHSSVVNLHVIGRE